MELTAASPTPARATIHCLDPATGEPLGEAPVVTPDEVRARVHRARAAQPAWARTSFAERRRVLGALLDHVLDHADELCRLIAREAGKTLDNALLGEIWPVCEKLRHTIATGERDLAPERVSSGLLVHKRARIEYHPLGVIGIIAPWNFPLQNVLGPTVPALMAGNAVIVKVSEWSSASAPRIQAMFDSVLRAAGHSPDLVQLVTGYGETGAALVDGGVDKIVFTGSMENGRRVLAQSARTLTPVILELGGKDPMIVCDDAALDQAVHAALAGAFIASGQMCLAAERIYVFDAIHDRFVDAVVANVGALRQGPPLAGAPVDVGAMTMPRQLEIVQRLVDDAVAKGARLRAGGRIRRDLGGQFFEPTVLTGVDHSMAIAREETFGPVMCIFRVGSDDEAVRLANDTAYGLGSTVFSTDAARARRIAERIVAGSTCVNAFGLAYMVNELPFGGVRGSGFGRLNGREGIRAMCNVKAMVEDRLPIRAPTKLYPVRPGDLLRTRHTLSLLYRRGLVQRSKAALALVAQLGRELLLHRNS
jgi:acyl-CoA reductase-like NAD-dependent aldehyde dehydrogenase